VQSSLNGRLRFTDRLGVNLSGSGLMNMREQPGLAAWFDSLDVASMLSSTGAIVAAGEAVALWSDRSGNSNERCLILPGTGYASTPHAAALDGAELDLRLDFTLDDYTPSADQVIINKYSAGQARFYVLATTGGDFTFGYSTDGTTGVGITKAYFGGTPANFSRQRIRITYKNGETIKFYYGTGFDTWTLYETDPDPGAALSNSTANLHIGATAAGTSNLIGKVHRVQIRSNILDDGTGIVFDSDFSLPAKLATSFTESSVGAATVTIATGARIAGARDLYQGTAANRPIYLPWSGSNYGWLNGVSGNYFSTPSAAALQLGATFCLVWEGTLDDWTPGTANTLTGKYSTTDNKRQYNLTITTAGAVAVNVSSDGGGANLTTLVSSATLGLTDRTKKAIRVDYVGAGATARFYTGGARGGPWTELGTEQSGTARTPFSSDTPLLVGGATAGTVQPHSGNTYYAAAIEGTFAAGTVVADFNPSLYTSNATFTAATGEVWTVNGGATIVTRSGLYFDGSNDYLKSAAFALIQPESICFIGEQVSWTSGDIIIDGNTVANRAQIEQRTTTPRIDQYSGSYGASLTTWALKTIAALFSVHNGASSYLRLSRSTATTGNAGTENMNGITLGASAGSTLHANVFVSELAILSVAHTTAQQDSIALYAGAKWRFST